MHFNFSGFTASATDLATRQEELEPVYENPIEIESNNEQKEFTKSLSEEECAGHIPPNKELYQVFLAQVTAINQRLKQLQLGPTKGYFQELRKPSAPPVNTLFRPKPSVASPVLFTFPLSPELTKAIMDEESSRENLPRQTATPLVNRVSYNKTGISPQ